MLILVSVYSSTLSALGLKLTEYWQTKTSQMVTQGGVTIIEPSNTGQPDWTWAQCDLCMKWRRLIDGKTAEDLPEKWYCRLNTDSTHKYVSRRQTRQCLKYFINVFFVAAVVAIKTRNRKKKMDFYRSERHTIREKSLKFGTVHCFTYHILMIA